MKNFLIMAALGLVISSCAPTLSYTWTKNNYEGAKYDKIAVFCATKNLDVAMNYQQYMVEVLGQQGFNAVTGMSMINPMETKNLEVEKLKEILIQNGVDAVISTVVVDSEKSLEYVPGSPSYGYYGGFGYYYGYRYGPVYYNPGYYNETTSYLVENHFYELKEGEPSKDALLWASQSTITDPNKSTTKVYARVIVKALVDENIIK
ncbi:hypothetical protein [Reichenbachiella ulvae]|uniref:DUF4136 domain-containing protein n=1 Tax=Reichenbachiella ulvae TaxID=2980104 RepID=A0ABT3CYC3_9BACT|nr:hypothetical protein [Reichenbachiella ulvae]MCV9388700.1 hypothetical protein [Reichenbachiella ulvae]